MPNSPSRSDRTQDVLRIFSRDQEWAGYVRRIAGGDDTALASLYDETSTLLYSIAVRILGNPADAEEVTLDVYTQIWNKAGSFDASRGSASAWIVMLARSRALDRLRSRAVQKRREEPLPEFLQDTLASPAVEPSEYPDIDRRTLHAALEKLSPEQRQVIELAFFSGFTQSELAKHLALPLGTVKTRVRLAMLKLRKALESLPISMGRTNAEA